MKKIVTVVGNRPQFVKAAIVSKKWAETAVCKNLQNHLIHTGQHYDRLLSDVFFEQLGLPEPELNLKIGSGPVIDQIGSMLAPLRTAIEEIKPDGIMVYGDTNSTLAAAIVAAHLHIPLFHVEAGERNYRRFRAPEEINRIITDELSWLCLTSTKKASQYLMREGYSDNRIQWVGDPMYDLYCWAKNGNRHTSVSLEKLNLQANGYILSTIHRNENTTEKDRLIDILSSLDCCDLPVVLPIHPRVRNLLDSWNWAPSGSLKIIEPLGYFDLLYILQSCCLCVTDSGGLAKEAFFAGKPSIIPMLNSGWNEIVDAGWAEVVPGTGAEILDKIKTIKPPKFRPENLFGDGNASEKIGNAILETLNNLKDEGEWHPLGNFDQIPKAKDRSKFTLPALINGLEDLKANGHHIVSLKDSKQLSIIYDVRGDLEIVSRLSQIHADSGHPVTFAFKTNSFIYNILNEDVQRLMKNILKKGHALALQIDSPNYTPDIVQHCKLIRGLLGVEIDWVCLQNHIISLSDSVDIIELNKLAASSDIPYYMLVKNKCEEDTVFFVEADIWATQPISLFESDQRLVSSVRKNIEIELGLDKI